MSVLDNVASRLVVGWVDQNVTAKTVKAFVDQRLADLAGYVAGTDNKIDDALLEEAAKDFDFDHAAEVSAAWLRSLFGLAPKMMMAGPLTHRLFFSLVRARLISEVCREKGCTRSAARQAVAAAEAAGQLSDQAILTAAAAHGIQPEAIGDGTILNWLVQHLPDLLKLIETLLPLILPFLV